MAVDFTFKVEGPILGWMRPAQGGRRRYDPPQQVAYKEMLAWECKIAMKAIGLQLPLKGPIALGVYAHYPYPGTGRDYPTHKISKPDLDNIIKNVKDALNRVAWADDAQVCRYLDPYKIHDPAAGAHGHLLIHIKMIDDRA